MDIQKISPALLYDDACYLCSVFARAADALAGGRLALVGHGTQLAAEIRQEHLGEGAAEMFWFIDGASAYGGRSGLLPLAREILFSRKRAPAGHAANPDCAAGCRTPKAFFLRSASILTHGRKIRIA